MSKNDAEILWIHKFAELGLLCLGNFFKAEKNIFKKQQIGGVDGKKDA